MLIFAFGGICSLDLFNHVLSFALGCALLFAVAMSPCVNDEIVHGHLSKGPVAVLVRVDDCDILCLQLYGLGTNHGEGGYQCSAEHFVLFCFILYRRIVSAAFYMGGIALTFQFNCGKLRKIVRKANCTEYWAGMAARPN